MAVGDVEITLLDGGGAVVVPGATVQLVLGTAPSGTAAQVVATRNPNTLVDVFTAGPLVEAGALSCLKGGTVLAMRAATITAGKIVGSDATPLAIASSTLTTPIAMVTTLPHGLITGSTVTIAGHLVNTNANGTWKITKTGANAFTIDNSVGNGVGGATGTVQPLGPVQIGTGTSIVTVSGVPYDDYLVRMKVVKGGTIGTTGITLQLSLDAGRHYGPVLALGTAVTFVIAATGLTLNFGVGTLVAVDQTSFATDAPLWDTGSVIACLDAIKITQYGVTGWGSSHLTGKINGADAATIQTNVESLATTFQIYTRMMMSGRDVKIPQAWGGPAETETAWLAAIALDFSALSARRVLVGAGNYNTTSAFPNIHAGSPAYRRPGTWSVAARRVIIPPQRHDGRVRDGSLDNIVIDPTNDPTDGFVYHDEFFNPALDTARFCSFRTRKKPGFFVVQPNLMSPIGSVFSILPYGAVMDVVCSIVEQVGQDEINDDIQLNTNGTITDPEARAIESVMKGQIDAQMTSKKQISSVTVVVDRTNDIATTKQVKIAVTVFARGYILTEVVTIGFGSPLAAGG